LFFRCRSSFFVLCSSFALRSYSVHVALLIATAGSWQGPLSLRKPATFGRSFGLTQFTVVWVSRFIALSRRARSSSSYWSRSEI
jgi:hypothetical protein